MMTSSGERTSRFFDSYAREFSDIYGNKNSWINRIVNELFRKSMKIRYQKTISGCEPVTGRSALDIGCGPGHYSVELARRGAAAVKGIDFAEGMIALSKAHAEHANVASRCDFELYDFFKFPEGTKFDFVIAMGFMDYMAEPKKVVEKAVSLTAKKAFFSFPADGGLLAWQRKLRYKFRCDLFMYTEAQVRALFADLPVERLEVERISRDFFVTATIAS